MINLAEVDDLAEVRDRLTDMVRKSVEKQLTEHHASSMALI